MVPLPEALWTGFRDGYLTRHLTTVRQWFALNNSKSDAKIFDVENLAGSLPMMFVLQRRDNVREVLPVGASTYPEDPIEAPLPANVFRHRLRTTLHRVGADIEVVDSILGHLDGATATHGDYSMRTWLEDAKTILPHLERAFQELGIEAPPDFKFDQAAASSAVSPTRFALLPSRQDTRSQEGRRTRQRRRLKVRAVRSARVLIATELKMDITTPAPPGAVIDAARLVAALASIDTADRLDRLGTKLMRAETGAPTTIGPLRYSYFLELVDRVWEEHNHRLPLRRRFMHRPRDDSPFRTGAPTARRRRSEIVPLLAEAVSGLVPSKVTAAEAMWLAFFDLALLNRNIDPQLRAALLERRPFRLVTLERECFLEWNADGDIGQLASPVQRMCIANRTAHALSIVLMGESKVVFPDSSPPRRFERIARACVAEAQEVPTLRNVFERLSAVVDQCNAIELPGTIAAYLAGRIRSTSLHWGEWVGLKTRQARDVRNLALRVQRSDQGADEGRPRLVRLESTASDTDARSTPAENAPGAALLLGGAKEQSRLGGQLAARNFVRALRKILVLAAGSEQRTAVTDRRRTARRAIEALVRQEKLSTSSAMHLLAHWTANLLERRHTRKLLAVSTVDRYLSALAPRFVALAHDRDLQSMDDEEIEELYGSLIDLSLRGRARYPYARLRELHAFAESHFGLPSIDWSTIVPDQETKLCAPGFVDEGSYCRILISLRYSPSFATTEERLAAMTLLTLAYRFGLRGGEALGLTVSDLHLEDSPPWLAVERNRARDLKSAAARRAVPLLHELRLLERKTLQNALAAAHRASTGLNGPAYLFPDLARPGCAIDGSMLKARVNAVIQGVSGKPYLSLHHLRHSHACRVWCELEGFQSKPSDREPEPDLQRQSESTRRILLGDTVWNTTRRAPWALGNR